MNSRTLSRLHLLRKLSPVCLMWLAAACATSRVKHRMVDAPPQVISALRQDAKTPSELGIRLVKRGDSQTAAWTERIESNQSVTVAFASKRFRRGDQPEINASINGHAVRLSIDTGAEMTAIDATSALTNGVKVADPSTLANVFRGVAGGEEMFYGMIDELEIGTLKWSQVFTVIRTRSLEQNGKLRPFNVLGVTSLQRLAYLQLDFPSQKVTFSPKDTYRANTNALALAVPFQLQGMQITVPTQIGTERLQAVIDTGNDAGILLTKDIASKAGVSVSASKQSDFATVGGIVSMREFTLPELRIDNVTFRKIPAVLTPADYPVTLGSGFLKRFKVTLDFKSPMLYLERK